MNLKVHLHSNTGKSFRGNQDNFLLLDLNNDEIVKGDSEDFSASREIDDVGKGMLLAVANGVGGSDGGKWASLLAVESVAEKYLEKDQVKNGEDSQNQTLKQLVQAARLADRKIFEKSRSDYKYSGSAAALTGAVLRDLKLHFFHLGENRLYLIRDRKIYQITKDQSFLHFLVAEGQLDAYAATHHCIRMEHWYYLGEAEGVYVAAAQAGMLDLRQNDILLFSTHGLFEFSYSTRIDYALTSNEILQTVLENKGDLSKVAAKLVEKLHMKEDFLDSVVMVLAEVNGDARPNADNNAPVIESVSIESLENF